MSSTSLWNASDLENFFKKQEQIIKKYYLDFYCMDQIGLEFCIF